MNAMVIAGLVKRRAVLAGDIETAHESLRQMVLDLENLDATILQFESAGPFVIKSDVNYTGCNDILTPLSMTNTSDMMIFI